MSGKVSKTSANRPVAKTERPKKAAAAKTTKTKDTKSVFLAQDKSVKAQIDRAQKEIDDLKYIADILEKTVKDLGISSYKDGKINKKNHEKMIQSHLFNTIRGFDGNSELQYHLENRRKYEDMCNRLNKIHIDLISATNGKFDKLPNSIKEGLLDLAYNYEMEHRNNGEYVKGAEIVKNNSELLEAIKNDDYSVIVSNLTYIDKNNDKTICGLKRRSFNRAALACRDLQGKELREAIVEAKNIYEDAVNNFEKNKKSTEKLKKEYNNFYKKYEKEFDAIQHENEAKEAARKDSIAQAELAKNDSIKGVNVDNQQTTVEDKKDEPGFFESIWNKVKNVVKSWFSSEDKEYEFDENISVMENMLNDNSVHIEDDENSGLMQVTVDYKVQKGDYLCVIAEKYGMQDCVIANNNNIEDANLIQEGQTIKMQKLAYKVKKGDRLENIAQNFGVSSITLREINNMDAKDNISENQVLEIPGFVYKVKERDTIEKIAEASGITAEKLKEINGLKENKIKAGDILKITYKDGDFSVPESDLKLFAENKNTDSKLNKDKEANKFSNATDLIKHYEGLHLEAYVCPAGKLTIGYGHTKGVKSGDVISEKVAEKYLRQDMKKAEQAVKKHVKVELTQCQYDALVSFVFNLGEGNFKRSTLLKLVNKGEFKKASHQFDRWIYAKGAPCKGLIKRRASEKELFLQDNNMSTMLADSRVAL